LGGGGWRFEASKAIKKKGIQKKIHGDFGEMVTGKAIRVADPGHLLGNWRTLKKPSKALKWGRTYRWGKKKTGEKAHPSVTSSKKREKEGWGRGHWLPKPSFAAFMHRGGVQKTVRAKGSIGSQKNEKGIGPSRMPSGGGLAKPTGESSKPRKKTLKKR